MPGDDLVEPGVAGRAPFAGDLDRLDPEDVAAGLRKTWSSQATVAPRIAVTLAIMMQARTVGCSASTPRLAEVPDDVDDPGRGVIGRGPTWRR